MERGGWEGCGEGSGERGFGGCFSFSMGHGVDEVDAMSEKF